MFSADCLHFSMKWEVRSSAESKDVIVGVGGLRKEKAVK